MRYSDDDLTHIFDLDRSSGRCHLCHGGLAFGNAGQLGGRGAWEIEHSVPLGERGPRSQHGAGVRHIQAMLGHADLGITAHYTHVVIDELKAAHQRAHPAEQPPKPLSL